MENKEKKCSIKDVMKAFFSNFDKFWIWFLLFGLIVTFNPFGEIIKFPIIDKVCYILGAIGFGYCLHHVAFWIFFPIKRDWMMVHENLLLRVICIALSVPFIVTSGVLHSKDDVTKEELVFGTNMYVQKPETIKIDKNKIDSVLNCLAQKQLSQTPIDSNAIDSNAIDIEKERLMLQLKKQAKIAGWREGTKEGEFIRDVDKASTEIKEKEDEPHLFWTVYYHFIDAGNQHMASSKGGRGWVALIAILGVLLLNGLLVSTLINYFDHRKERWQKGEVRYRLRSLGKNKFAVILGGNEIATTVVKNLLTGKKTPDDINFKCEGDNKYVILQTCRDPQTVRDELSAHLPEKMMKRVIIYKALRNSIEELKNLYLDYTTEIYVLGESVTNDGGETYHDALNMECVNLIAKMLQSTLEKRVALKAKGISARKVCKVLFEYQTTFSIFQFSGISKTVEDNLVFIPFNRYESWAREVIVNSEKYTPLDGSGIKEDSDEYVHFIVVGMSKMGIAMGTQAMLHAHYLNSKKRKTRITFVDTQADKEMAFFKGRYSNLFELTRHRFVDCDKNYSSSKKYNWEEDWIDPIEKAESKWKHLSVEGKNFIDIEIEFVKGELESGGVREFLCQATEQKDAKVTIAICLTQTHQAIAAALYLPIEIYKSDSLQEVWVYQSESADIINNLRHELNRDLRYRKLRPFGMILGEYMSDRSQYLKAMLVNAAYDININKKYAWPEDITDKEDTNYKEIKKAWKGLSVEKKWSNKYFVDSIYQKIKSAMCLSDEFEKSQEFCSQIKNGDLSAFLKIKGILESGKLQLAICEHNRWNLQQLLLGYSPCDEQLNHILEQQQIKDDDVIRNELNQWALDNLNQDIRGLKDIKPKDLLKESELRIHSNICAYEHLDKVDKSAKRYDSELNNAIPTILDLVDIRPQRK